jgi:hypothetical protein
VVGSDRMTHSRRLLTAPAAGAAATIAVVLALVSPGCGRSSVSGCQLSPNGQIKRLVNIVFDNTHYVRDRDDVPSDLEQMPHLLGFLTSNGTLFTNDHTILISHTAGGILSSLTGLYPNRNGQTVSNSYDFYRNNGTPTFTTSFKYWTAPVDGADDSKPNMIAETGKNTPAPWVPFTRAGCDVGGVGTANIELENNSIAPGGDIYNVYGPGSAEAMEPAAQRTTDFLGIAIHCARTTESKCADNPKARSDPLPDEPGGYTGYKALFGTKYVNPAITDPSDPCVNDTSGRPIRSSGICGFPGFDRMLAQNSLGYVAQMLESGLPVVYAYVSDAHDNHRLGRASGPGETDYKQQLEAYDEAFAAFFQRLEAHHIDKTNTLFVVSVDEGDHFAGGTGTPDGGGNLTYTHTACPLAPVASSCPANQIGEVNVRIGSVLPAGEPAFELHADSAPAFYVNGDAAHPNGPSRTDPAVRKLERDVWHATAPDPYKAGKVPIAQFMADTVGERALHMVDADPKRTPTFTMFGNPDFFFQTKPLGGGCAGSDVCVNPAFAWNHGDVQEEIAKTWVGFVGPGVQRGGIDSETWTDHTNVRPTILRLLGLEDDYVQDGRVLIEVLTKEATPQTLLAHRETLRRLGDVYEQLNASFGSFAMEALRASTAALSTSDEVRYGSIEDSIASLTTQRDALAARIRGGLNAAAFEGKALNEQQAKSWIDQAQRLIDQADALAPSS